MVLIRRLLLASVLVLAPELRAQSPIRATTDDGRKVLLYANNTWKFASEPARQTSQGGTFSKPGSAARTVDIHPGATRLSYDPDLWTPESSTDRTKLMFQHNNGDGYAMVIKERLQMTLDALKEIALTNAVQAAPDARIVHEEIRTVNGAKVLCLTIEGTTSGIAFTYFGYYYTGKAGIVQLVTYTGQNLFEEYKPDFENFLNGFEVVSAQ
jgi:hypothetical protein